MADVLKASQTIIKLKTGTGAPDSLKLGEAAFDKAGKVLYIGGDSGVVKISDPAGIDTALAALKTELSKDDKDLGLRIDGVVADLTKAKTDLAAADTALGLRIDGVVTDYKAADAEVTAAFKKADADIIAAYEAADVKLGKRIEDIGQTLVSGVVDTTTDQTIEGEKTFTSIPIVPTAEPGNASTYVATTKFVGDAVDVSAAAIKEAEFKVEGDDVSGSGSVSEGVQLVLKDVGVAGTYTKVTTDAKGRIVTGAALTAGDIPTLTASKISDFATVVESTSLDKFDPAQADVNLNGNKLVGVATPEKATDAVNKGYVDAIAQGLNAKAAVRAASALGQDLTLSGPAVVDGVSLVEGDRVLVKNQTKLSENGIYVVKADKWARTPEHDEWKELVSAFVFVESGTTNADTGWVCTVDAGGTIDVDPVEWVQFSAAGTVQAGVGLAKNGNVLSVNGVADQIVVDAAGVGIAATYAGQASITTVGTIATGTWEGNVVDVAHGGTGLSVAVSGIVKGANGAYAAAVDGTDYMSKIKTDEAISAAIAIIDGGTY